MEFRITPFEADPAEKELLKAVLERHLDGIANSLLCSRDGQTMYRDVLPAYRIEAVMREYDTAVDLAKFRPPGDDAA